MKYLAGFVWVFESITVSISRAYSLYSQQV